MKTLVALAVGAGLTVLAAPQVAEAGTIQRACNASDRPAATRSLCRCIQKSADGILSRADQRKVSQFFRDPHRAQEVRMSDRQHDEAFWDRYKKFGDHARRNCS
ncbi:MAG TPA: hypothetical protein DEA05_10390 [Rhodobacteraceae bacterium]|nr:hypothetical protein [Paracoccaceae bacterium]